MSARLWTDAGSPAAGRPIPPSRAGLLPVAMARLGPALLAAIRRAEPGRAALVAQFSVYSALALAEGGAAGATRSELRRALFTDGVEPAVADQAYADLLRYFGELLESDDDSSVEFHIANALWLDDGLAVHDAFLQRNRESYGAALARQDLAAAEVPALINGWIHEHTKGRIGALVDQLPPDAAAVLANSVYLKAPWNEPFQTPATTDRPFHRADGSTIVVPTMWGSLTQAGYRATDRFEATRLGFGERVGSMILYLPRPAQNPDDVLAALVAERDVGERASWETPSIELQLPRFRVAWRGSLVQVLQALGVRRAFDPSTADFSDLAAEPLAISEVVHGAFTEVNEAGLEAAAATVVLMMRSMLPVDPPKLVVVDRPFVFEIEVAGVSMFLGLVEDPS